MTASELKGKVSCLREQAFLEGRNGRTSGEHRQQRAVLEAGIAEEIDRLHQELACRSFVAGPLTVTCVVAGALLLVCVSMGAA